MSDHYEFVHYKQALVKYYVSDGISADREALVFARQYLVKKYGRRLAEHKCHLVSQQLHVNIALLEARERERLIVLTSDLADRGKSVELLTSEMAKKEETIQSLLTEQVDREQALNKAAAELASKESELERMKALLKRLATQVAEKN